MPTGMLPTSEIGIEDAYRLEPGGQSAVEQFHFLNMMVQLNLYKGLGAILSCCNFHQMLM
jgi:hypothetical protein